MSEQLKLFNVDTEIYRVMSVKGAVPFVYEVEEFTSTFKNPNNYDLGYLEWNDGTVAEKELNDIEKK